MNPANTLESAPSDITNFVIILSSTLRTKLQTVLGLKYIKLWQIVPVYCILCHIQLFQIAQLKELLQEIMFLSIILTSIVCRLPY